MRGHLSIDRFVSALERAPRRGGVLWPLLALVALIALALLAWLTLSAPTAPHPVLDVSEAGATEASTDGLGAKTQPLAAADESMGIEPVLEIGRSSRQPRPEPKPFDESRLNGRGLIRGSIEAAPGIDFPTEWVLSLEPSNVLIGAERAERRTLEFHAGEQDFEFRELALGGYMLRASAFGMASEQQHLLLVRPNETELVVQMQFLPTAFIEGAVRHEDSTPVVGLELALEPKPAGARVFTTSDGYGHFLFTDVKSGAYTLHFGQAENPVRPATEVHVGVDPQRLPDSIVPPLAELIVHVLLSSGVPAVDAQLDGYGSHGGRILGKTNAEGEYRARSLPAGRYTIDAVAADGRRARGRKVVEIGSLGLLELRLEP